jgi:hypothetical protein
LRDGRDASEDFRIGTATHKLVQTYKLGHVRISLNISNKHRETKTKTKTSS